MMFSSVWGDSGDRVAANRGKTGTLEPGLHHLRVALGAELERPRVIWGAGELSGDGAGSSRPRQTDRVQVDVPGRHPVAMCRDSPNPRRPLLAVPPRRTLLVGPQFDERAEQQFGGDAAGTTNLDNQAVCFHDAPRIP